MTVLTVFSIFLLLTATQATTGTQEEAQVSCLVSMRLHFLQYVSSQGGRVCIPDHPWNEVSLESFPSTACS